MLADLSNGSIKRSNTMIAPRLRYIICTCVHAVWGD